MSADRRVRIGTVLGQDCGDGHPPGARGDSDDGTDFMRSPTGTQGRRLVGAEVLNRVGEALHGAAAGRRAGRSGMEHSRCRRHMTALIAFVASRVHGVKGATTRRDGAHAVSNDAMGVGGDGSRRCPSC